MSNSGLMGIYRETVFSPGKEREDATIMNGAMAAAVLSGFRDLAVIRSENILSKGLHPNDLSGLRENPACVLSMAQSHEMLRFLEDLEKIGVRVINSVRSVRNCYRKSLIRSLLEAKVPLPRSRIMPLSALMYKLSFDSAEQYWIKRADVHAGEVIPIKSREDLEIITDHFYRRLVKEVVVQEHVAGELIKFYGVGPGVFFEAFRVSTGERITPVMARLDHIAGRSARAVGLEIFGGDAVLTPQGDLFLIDLNDWPSFSACSGSAAEVIGRYVAQIVLGGNNDTDNEFECSKRYG